jgi:hypothetical protein
MQANRRERDLRVALFYASKNLERNTKEAQPKRLGLLSFMDFVVMDNEKGTPGQKYPRTHPSCEDQSPELQGVCFSRIQFCDSLADFRFPSCLYGHGAAWLDCACAVPPMK